MSASYKERQEAFVSGLAGSSPIEVVSLLAVLPALSLLNRVLLSFFAAGGGGSIISPPCCWSLQMRFVVEFIVIVVPTLLNLTVFAGMAATTVVAVLLLCGALHIIALARMSISLLSINEAAPSSGLRLVLSQPQKAFINSFRASMMLSTCVERGSFRTRVLAPFG